MTEGASAWEVTRSSGDLVHVTRVYPRSSLASHPHSGESQTQGLLESL